MWLALIAAFLFLVAFVLHAAGNGHYVTDLWLAGLFFTALHLALAGYVPWPRRRPAPPAD